jgi:competence protein ComEA
VSRRSSRLLALAITTLVGAAAHADPSARPMQHPSVRPAVVAPATPSGPLIDLNGATPEELEQLPGIGPTRAHAIVEHRQAHPFKKVDELTKVKGIGRKTFSRLRPLVTLGGARK